MSLIGSTKIKRVEFVYISLDNLYLELEDTESKRVIRMTIGDFQIDNQTSTNVIFPEILSTQIHKNWENKWNNFLELSLRMRRSSEGTELQSYEEITILLQTIILKLDNEILSYFLNFTEYMLSSTNQSVGTVHKIFIPKSKPKHKHPYTQTEQQQQQPKSKFKPNNNTDSKSMCSSLSSEDTEMPTKKMYILKMHLSPIEIMFTFFKKVHSNIALSSNSNVILNALGVVFTNISNAPIRMNGIQLFHVFGYPYEISDRLFSLYRTQILKNVLKLIFSIDIIGNPLSLLRSVATGVKDFFYKPVKGIFLCFWVLDLSFF